MNLSFPQKSVVFFGAMAFLTLCTGCPPSTTLPDGGNAEFDDHTQPFATTKDDLLNMAKRTESRDSIKFILSDFTKNSPELRLLESSSFYTLHDEWYWFHLLNGQFAPGSNTAPYAGSFSGSFPDVPAIYTWAQTQETLPLDLRWAGDERLYSPEFYAKSLSDVPRSYGIGTLFRFPERILPDQSTRDEIWAFELEYSDNVSPAEIAVYFDGLLPNLPPSIADSLKWLVRSPNQENTAQQIEQNNLPYADRIIRYSAITIAGEVEVYAPGLAAGRIRVIRSGESGLEDSRATDILVLEDIPDYLPPCAALITAKPQTPLAHINVLARNRQIPNLYIAGILDDPALDALARIRAPAILKAQLPTPDEKAQYQLKAISNDAFNTWRTLIAPPPVAVPAADLENAPYFLDLRDLDANQMDSLRPLIGGKSAGFLGLLAPEKAGLPPLIIPDQPLAITARVFYEHRQKYASVLDAILNDSEFRRSARARFLVLEGAENFLFRYSSQSDRDYLDNFLNDRPNGHLVGDVVRQGGLVQKVRDTPLDDETLTLLLQELTQRYAGYAISQGLRFRSSSTIEDIEGFNGAGLYTSNTGFLFPELQNSAKNRKRSVEHALLKTFSSYWGAEAFEERELANVLHESGHMAVLVHARFDDEQEVSNGVFTFTVLPPLPPQSASAPRIDDEYLLEVNVQKGALSITNPPPGSTALPEVFEVRQRANEAPRVIRLAASTEIPENETVFSDEKALHLFTDAKAVTKLWLERENASLLSAQKARTFTLDFELREMNYGWPALANGGSFSKRVVIKQARSLEPGLQALPRSIASLPIPKDVLARAAKIERRTCTSDAFSVSLVEVYTDTSKTPNLKYDQKPFTGFITFNILQAIPEAELSAGRRFSLTHTALDNVRHAFLPDGPWSLDAALTPAYADIYGFDAFAIDTEKMQIGVNETSLEFPLTAGCTREVLFATPSLFLQALLDENN